MMRFRALLTLGALLGATQPALSAAAQQPVPVRSPVIRFATTTHNQQAQKLIERGLLLYYAYNGPASARLFQQAAKIDSTCAMAYWGVALADGPNLNFPITREGFAKAKAAINKALRLANGASERERAYIEALAKRYTGTYASWAANDQRYMQEMDQVRRAYPEDENATLLYLEVVIENTGLTPLWRNVNYAFERDQIERLLEGVLRRDPWNPMANHLLVHVYDFAPDRTAAIPSADRLSQLNVEPDAGHLVHMPAHAYVEQGYYADAVRTSMRACVLDQSSTYHVYDAHDYFVGQGAAMEGASYSEAANFVKTCAPTHGPFRGEDPEAIAARFYRWQDILSAPPDDVELHQILRVEALAALGRGHEAAAALAEVSKRDPQIKKAAPFLYAKVALVNGDRSAAVALTNAALKQSEQDPGEPPELAPPGERRETLGHLLYSLGRYKEAERAFRADLAVHPNNGRALFGLWHTLQAEGKAELARWAEAGFREAWAGSDTSLKMQNL